MDFFKSQDVARHNTVKLVFYFILAVICMIALTNLLVLFVLGYINMEEAAPLVFTWDEFWVIGGVVCVVVAMGTLYKVIALSGGGAKIAEAMDATLVVAGSGDAKQHRLLNVVEEMAIASAVPVPPVYILEESAINAFAAGYSPSDAVIGVTRGAVNKLTRDELQGVIAHEFSHILNGDMRLNIRLIGILHGILLIGLIGHFILRWAPNMGRSRKGGGLALAGMIFGIGLLAIGYVGTFFGNLIKAAVSRQREYLADASAVQFTRNPDGIGRALIRIGTKEKYSILDNPNSEEISHTLFCQGVSFSLKTHPPLEARIKRILPDWDGKFVLTRGRRRATKKVTSKENLAKKKVAVVAAASTVLEPGEVLKLVGQPSTAHLDYARKLLDDLPEELRRAVHEPHGAEAFIYALVLAKNDEERQKQIQLLQITDKSIYLEIEKLSKALVTLKTEYRLPLVDMALAALRQMSAPQYLGFKENFNKLITADSNIELFEWVLQKIVFRHLAQVYEKKPKGRNRKPTIKRAKEACSIMFSLLSRALRQTAITQQQAFAAAQKEVDWLDIELMENNGFDFSALDSALDDLSRLKPTFKAKLLKAATAIVLADQHVTSEETELLRAISETLECPIPPLVA